MTRGKTDRRSRTGLGCFFGVFLLMGGGFLAYFGYSAVQILQARGWRQTPCVIRSSEVRSHAGDDGETYSVAVSYEYEIDGAKRTSDRYKFLGGSSSGYSGKKAVVDRLPPGRQTVCYVNPKNSAEAVLERGFTADMWFGLIPLLFMGVGIGGLIFAFRKPAPPAPSKTFGLKPTPAGPVVLKPAVAPVVRFLIVLGVTLFWNGIVSVFLILMLAEFRWIALFLIPFVLVGLGLIAYAVHQFLALFNPRPALTVNAGAVALGDALELQWETSGNVHRIRSFRITLEGREEATYRRGTSTSTDKSVFCTIELARGKSGKEFRRGRARVEIPGTTMHTFRAPNNKILWALHVQGEIPVWPDVKEEFPIEILPRSPGKGAPA